MITSPMLAYNGEYSLEKDVRYPVLLTPKIDGIRCLKIDGRFVSKTLKPIPNKYIVDILQGIDLPDGLDGELITFVKDEHKQKSFNDIQSDVMSEDGMPVFKYVIFDWIGSAVSYIDRLKKLFCVDIDLCYVHKFDLPVWCETEEHVKQFNNKYVKEGFEGSIIRTPDSPYKQGRCTLHEAFMFKIVEYERREAIIMSFTFNTMHRDRIGAIVVIDEVYGKLKLGSGFDLQFSRECRNNLLLHVGKTITYKFKPYGMKDKPRQPVFVGFRDERDL